MGFPAAVTAVLKREGGSTITDDPSDPGGLTRYGISQRAYPTLDIRNLTLQQAQQIYHNDYWQKISGDELHDVVSFILFDCAVNQGVSKAIKFLQRALGVPDDGVLGPKTLAAAKGADHKIIAERLQAERILHYASLPTWGKYGKGWSRRVVGNTIEAFNP